MMKGISIKISSFLCENNIVEKDKQELYTYALEIFLSSTLHIFTTLFIGFICGMPLESLTMYLVFSLVRRYAGGFHAKTPLRCYLTSVAAIILMLILIKVFTKLENDMVFYVTLTISNLTIWIASPIESTNKKLSYKEKKVFKAVSIALSCIITALAVMIYEIFAVNFGVSIGFGLVLTALVLHTSLIHDMLYSKRKNTMAN